MVRAVLALGLIALGCAIAPGVVIVARCALARAQPPTPTAYTPPADIPEYGRPGSSTYLTLPEWFIVYSTEEYAAWIRHAPPSGFPYLGSILDFWSYYRGVCDASCGAYPFDAGNHVMLVVIGSSFAVENGLKSVYENIIGRGVEAISGHDTAEDAFAAQVAAEYGRFMHTTPWYEFPFGAKLTALWRRTPAWGAHPLRKWERRFALSTEYAIKAAYGWLIRVATKSAYGDESLRTFVRAEHVPADLSGLSVERVRVVQNGAEILALERYEKFTPTASVLAARGVRFLDIAGNRRVLVTVIAPAAPMWGDASAHVLFSRPLATDHTRVRAAVDVEVSALGSVLSELNRRGATLEHIYDY